MPLNGKPSRYAHPEGHTDVCYFTGKKGGLLTCGSDGDVRSWLNLMDDDPAASCISEQVIAIVSKNGKLYVATDNNTVQILTYPDLEKEGIITRFTGTVCALATAKNGNLIVSGSCDMRIQVSNVETSDSIELNGHQGPILGLSLDPREEYVASSSTDGSIRVWDIKEKRLVHSWNNVVPKGNSFFTSKTYSTPSFECLDGKTLAYPQGKEIIVVERSSWKELFKLRSPDLKAELSICKFSQCGKLLAASSIHGEIIVWDIESKEQIGYSARERGIKITAIAWSPEKPTEIAFCDSLGMLGCVDVVFDPVEELFPKSSDAVEFDEDLDNRIENYVDGDEDDDGDNVISLNKIKATVNLDDFDNSNEPTAVQRPQSVDKFLMPEIKAQEPFQPGSSPVHLMNRYMAWNNTGIIKCYASEDGQESSIEVEFHDSSVHHAIHVNNYLQHTLAALSPKALALACVENDDTPSKLVVVRLQGWGSGNKEWSIELPQGELPLCLAAGDNFVAIATSKRRLRLFTASGVQRGIIALPGSPVVINALGHHLVAVCHSGSSGFQEEQNMTMLWLQIRGSNVRNRSLAVPISGSKLELAWAGLTDRGSPAVMDKDGVLAIYDSKSCVWNVACDTANQRKGASDNFFIIGVNETEKTIRCVLCKGSLYPPTAPTPTQIEIPLQLPLCEIDSVKSQMEAKFCQFGSDTRSNEETLLSMFVLACRGNAEYRAVDLCEEFASQKVLELAMKYAGRLGQTALATKLQTLAKSREEIDPEIIEDERKREEKRNRSIKNHVDEEGKEIEDTEDDYLLISTPPNKPAIEIRPITLSMRRQNPFKKTGKSPTLKGLQAMNRLPENPRGLLSGSESVAQKPKPKQPSKSMKESFIVWYGKNKKNIGEEFPEFDDKQITMKALERYKEIERATIAGENSSEESIRESKKRKLSDAENERKRNSESTMSKLSSFAFEN